jgi:FkbM family methyltransferase
VLRQLCSFRTDPSGREWLWPVDDTETWKVVHQELAEIPEILATLDRLGKARRNCIQAGGNGGLWVRPLGEAFQRVYTFEPDPLMHRCLAYNVDLPNVVITQAALGDGQGFCDIDRWCGPRNPGANRIAPGAGGIPVVAIDDYGLFDVDLIQLDIEGYEMKALQGADSTIALCRPVIVTELRNHATHYGTTDARIREWLEARGYTASAQINHDVVWTPS